MALCNITGAVYLPSGQVAVSRQVVFRREDRNITADYLGTLFPDDVTVYTGADGHIDVRLITGRYVAFANTTPRSYFGVVTVPNRAAADFSDIIGVQDLPDTAPVWYEQALLARNEAVEAASRAEDSYDSAQDAADRAEQSATEADAARDAAILAGNVYPSVAEGLIATPEGGYFTHPGYDGMEVYHVVGGQAVLDTVIPNMDAVRVSMETALNIDVEGVTHASTDDAGNRTWLEASSAHGGPTNWALQHIWRLTPSISDYGGVSGSAFQDISTGMLGNGKLTDTSKMSIWGASDAISLQPALQEMAAGFGASFFAGTIGNAWIAGVLADQGCKPALIRFPNNTIPSSAAEIQVEWLNDTRIQNVRPRPVVVEGLGVQGVSRGNTWRRSNIISGVTQPVVLSGPVRVISIDGVAQADGVQLWSMGFGDIINVTTLTADDTQRRVRAGVDLAFDRHPTADKRVLFLGFWCPQGTDYAPGSLRHNAINSYNTYIKGKYQERVVDQKAYLSSAAVWTHTGITPSADDLAAQSRQQLAPSLANDATHLNAAAAAAVVNNLIRPRLIALGWYQ